jgi:hypothetical protein
MLIYFKNFRKKARQNNKKTQIPKMKLLLRTVVNQNNSKRVFGIPMLFYYRFVNNSRENLK